MKPSNPDSTAANPFPLPEALDAYGARDLRDAILAAGARSLDGSRVLRCDLAGLQVVCAAAGNGRPGVPGAVLLHPSAALRAAAQDLGLDAADLGTASLSP